MVMDFSLHTTVLWAVAVLEVGLLLSILFRYQRTPSIWSLCWMLVSFALMAFFVGFLLEVSIAHQLLVAKAAFYAGACSFVALFSLAVFFPLPTAIERRDYWLTIFIPLVFLVWYIFFNTSFITSVVVDGSSISVTTGSSYGTFIGITSVYFGAALVLLLTKMRVVIGSQRRLTRALAVIVGITGTFGIITNNVFPLIGQPSSVYGPEGTFFIALLFSLIVLRKV